MSNKEVGWKKMGFKSEQDYNEFLKAKKNSLFDMIKNNPKLLDVFKRLHSK